MVKQIKIDRVDDYLKKVDERKEAGVYFYKLNFYNQEVKNFLKKYLKKTKENGLYIKNRLQNPTANNINYFMEFIGSDFFLEKKFFEKKLKRWLPQLTESENKEFSNLVFETLNELKKEGKNESILKNVYMKFMCWSYYKFQYVIKRCYEMREKETPKILFEGEISNHELLFLNIISKLGCDVLILQYSQDVKSQGILEINILPKNNFPENFCLENLLFEELEEEKIRDFIDKGEEKREIDWLSGDIFESILKPIEERGKKKDVSYSVFAKILGVEDVNSYEMSLVKFRLKLEEKNRKFILIENGIKNPEYEEVSKILKPTLNSKSDVLLTLSKNIFFSQSLEKTKVIQKIFINSLLEEKEESLQKFFNKSVVILCWLIRYMKLALDKHNSEYYPVFLYYGSCNNQNEQLLLKILSRLDIDVIILCPDKSQEFKLEDRYLYEKIYEGSLPITKFPKDIKDIKLRTVAANAEKDLENILYRDTGLYKANQFKKAVPLNLNTIYEEIGILWKEEAKYRPNFEILKDSVIVPNICAKIVGVPDKNTNQYWKSIEKYVEDEEYFAVNFPIFTFEKNNILNTVNFFKKGKLNFEKLKQDKNYKYSFIREEMQDYILEKIQFYLENRSLKTNNLENNENKILHLLLNLDIEILRKIQDFDFTKKIPKLVILDTKEDMGKIDDAIIIEFLKEVGFDILLFVPTGYRSLESYFSKNIFVEYQIGEFMYDLKIPKFDREKRKFNVSKIDLKSIFNILN